jgi:hypothetical protein
LLIFYAGIVTFLLSVISRGTRGTISFLPALAVFVLSVTAVSSALLISDRNSIATFRRTAGVLLAGEMLWLFCAASGLVYVLLGGPSSALNNAILFGALLCAGLEFLVINGAFTGNSAFSLALAAIYPASTLAIIRLPRLSSSLDVFDLLSGVAAFLVTASLVPLLNRKKTSRGYSAITLFRSFMRTWSGNNSAELEQSIWDHGEDA